MPDISKFRVKTIVYDMDGLLIDSEPLWHASEQSIFRELGVPLTSELCLETTGMRIAEVATHWRARFPWSGPSDEEVGRRIAQRVQQLVLERGQAMPGALRSIELFQTMGFSLALASSSPPSMIEAVCERLKLQGVFQVRCSADALAFGKPHPEVFLNAAEEMGVKPTACLALEDSLNGVLAAKSARMLCLAVPAAEQRQDGRFAIADGVFDSLEQLSEQWILQNLA